MFINPAVDESSRAAKVIAEVRNTDGVLKGGMFATGRILVSNRADVVQVPRAALLNWNVTAATAEVFVVSGSTAEKRVVKTGPAAGARVAVESGVAPGEQVVTRGGFALKPGDAVAAAKEGV
jgi:RND family efflux transporter MFP subunit